MMLIININITDYLRLLKSKKRGNIMKKKILTICMCLSFVLSMLIVNTSAAEPKIAKLIVFSTLGDNHSFIMVENYQSSSLRIGHYNVGGNRKVTLGTWGNIKQHTGLWYNLESVYPMASHVSAGKELTASDVVKLNNAINSFDKWSPLTNCSSFATHVWNKVAVTQLSAGLVNTPSNLAKSIKEKLDYYTTNRYIEPKTSDYIYYHTSSNKVECSSPTFTGGSGSSGSSSRSNNVKVNSLDIDENYVNSFN